MKAIFLEGTVTLLILHGIHVPVEARRGDCS